MLGSDLYARRHREFLAHGDWELAVVLVSLRDVLELRGLLKPDDGDRLAQVAGEIALRRDRTALW